MMLQHALTAAKSSALEVNFRGINAHTGQGKSLMAHTPTDTKQHTPRVDRPHGTQPGPRRWPRHLSLIYLANGDVYLSDFTADHYFGERQVAFALMDIRQVLDQALSRSAPLRRRS